MHACLCLCRECIWMCVLNVAVRLKRPTPPYPPLPTHETPQFDSALAWIQIMNVEASSENSWRQQRICWRRRQMKKQHDDNKTGNKSKHVLKPLTFLCLQQEGEFVCDFKTRWLISNINNRTVNKALRCLSGSSCDSRENSAEVGFLLLILSPPFFFFQLFDICTVDLKTYPIINGVDVMKWACCHHLLYY